MTKVAKEPRFILGVWVDLQESGPFEPPKKDFLNPTLSKHLFLTHSLAETWSFWQILVVTPSALLSTGLFVKFSLNSTQTH